MAYVFPPSLLENPEGKAVSTGDIDDSFLVQDEDNRTGKALSIRCARLKICEKYFTVVGISVNDKEANQAIRAICRKFCPVSVTWIEILIGNNISKSIVCLSLLPLILFWGRMLVNIFIFAKWATYCDWFANAKMSPSCHIEGLYFLKYPSTHECV